MGAYREEKPDSHGPIELEPAQPKETPRYIEANGPLRTENLGSIPQKPVHLCPNCDYNLTGLTNNRCPECGEEFNRSEARIRGIEVSLGAKSVLYSLGFARLKAGIGIALILASILYHNFSTSSWQGWLGLRLSLRGGWLLSVLPFIILVAILGRVRNGEDLYDTVWKIGLLVAAAAAFLAIF